MAEYIDREAFKKSVEERYCKPCKAEGKDRNGCWCRACWVDDMLSEVDCFPPPDASGKLTVLRWIPVTERLPEGDGHYLCRYGFEGAGMTFYQTLDYYATDVQPHFQHEGLRGMRVTHWMPLPEAPEVE